MSAGEVDTGPADGWMEGQDRTADGTRRPVARPVNRNRPADTFVCAYTHVYTPVEMAVDGCHSGD